MLSRQWERHRQGGTRAVAAAVAERVAALLAQHAGRLLTTDHVLVETWYLAASRLGVDVAERLVDGIRAGAARVENTLGSDLEAAASTREAFGDQGCSIVDRTNWSVMIRLGVHEALSFDRDYAVFRFGRRRSQAFTVYS
jgi:predicted nucleic acid-binding protein